jgi:primosomal protein N' (replication factor Y)
MALVPVALPGPWWTQLSYSHTQELSECLRVRVPLGKSSRVGITSKNSSQDDVKDIKELIQVIDESQVLPDELWQTICWFGDTWFTGLGLAAKTLLPTKFFDGEELAALRNVKAEKNRYSVKYVYEPRDDKRFEKYSELMTGNALGSLMLFPEFTAAKKFWQSLPDSVKDSGALFPAAASKKQWELWKAARGGQISFIVGSPSASFVPLAGLSRIIIDEESSGAWLTQKYPIFHCRSLLAARAKFAGAELVLGGRLPSSKASMQCQDTAENEGAAKRVVFVDLHDSSASDIDGVKDTMPISRPLIRETIACRKNKKWALWLLDRKGYAGEIYCADCGAPVRCERCGGVMRWESKGGRLVCLNCSAKMPVPERCPACGGLFLQGVRPGLEALHEKAVSLLKYSCGDVIAFGDDSGKMPSAAELAEKYPDGAVITGTRKILAFADELSVGSVGWIDADSEARGEAYDAKVRAFGLVWESLWRGLDPDCRTVVVQSRRPGRDWQAGLVRGWKTFWDGELKYRHDFELPPFMPMVEVQMPKGRGKILAEKLENSEFDFIESDESPDKIFIRTKQFGKLRKILEPYYNISNTRTGMPKVFLSIN